MKVRLTVAAALAGALLFPGMALGAFSVLHSFGGPEGETPAAPLVLGTDGFLYGVAAHGGDFTVLPPDGGGTAFRLDRAGNFTLLHVFTGPDGAVPNSLIQGRDGFFYGTSTYGGTGPVDPLFPGTGALFRMDAAGKLTVLKAFPGGAGGAFPGPIVQGGDGALYGTAAGGVVTLNRFGGFVYRFDPGTGDFRVLHNFVLSDGLDPTGALFQGTDGFFYGTTNQGGANNAGVVYKVDATGAFALLHAFTGSDGAEPKAGVIQASDGLLYGTTELGMYGGTIFRLGTAGGGFAVLHSFDAYASDGWKPVSGLIEARDGFLYGTAPIGGQPVSDPSRAGVVYRIDFAGNVTVVHTFTGPDGASPRAAVLQAADGRLYGTTIAGGVSALGTVFVLDPSGTGAPPPQPPVISALTLSPNTISGGSESTGKVTLSGSAPPGGAVVSLTTNGSWASIPASVTVPEGASFATFNITTKLVKRTKATTISASYNASSATAQLTITP